MDDIRLEKRTIQERLIIAKTLIETALSDLPTADLSEYCDKLWKTAYERGRKEATAEPNHDEFLEFLFNVINPNEMEQYMAMYNSRPNCGARMEESE